MGTLRSVKSLLGYHLYALDGEMGQITDFLFDDAQWLVRYFVVDVSHWLIHKKILIPPEALGLPNDNLRTIPISVKKEQIGKNPSLKMDKPIFLQHKAQSEAHYPLSLYLGAEALLGGSDPGTFSPEEPCNKGGKPFDPHLRSWQIVGGYPVKGSDGFSGKTVDFLAEDGLFKIKSLVVSNPQGLEFNLSPDKVERISFEESCLYVSSGCGKATWDAACVLGK